jgi:hypothetical protein
LAVWCAVALSGSGKAVLVDRVVATVGTQAITRSVLAARSKGSQLPERDALDRLIEERVIAEECRRLGITVPPEEIEAAIQEVLKTAKISPQELDQELKRRGMELDGYRALLKAQLFELKWLTTKGGPTLRGETGEQRFKRINDARDKWVGELRAKAVIEVRL